MNTDLSALSDGDIVTLHPGLGNPLHDEPVKATFQGGYFYCEGTDPLEGPDYYWGDVLTYCKGWTT